MILTRLYELARRQSLLDDPAFEPSTVMFAVQLDANGEYRGVLDVRGEVEISSKKKGAPPKKVLGKGLAVKLPRPHGSPNSPGFARYFVDTLPRVLPVNDDAKSVKSRATFWRQLDEAADATDDPALRAVQSFGRKLTTDPDLAAKVGADVAAHEPGGGDRVTFAWRPDGGRTILERPTVRDWFAAFFGRFTGGKQEAGPSGLCQITGRVGPLPTSHPIKLSGIPGGSSMGVSIVSFDKEAFESYGLDKAANAGIGYDAADGYTRAFQWLRSQPQHRVSINNTLFLFWTRRGADPADVNPYFDPTPDQVAAVLRSADAGKSADATEPDDFYILAVSGNSARAIVRDYLELPLADAKANVARWFTDLMIADPSKEWQGKPRADFPLWLLAASTALEAERVAPDVYPRLVRAALADDPLPDSILAACLGRLRADGADGFRAARMGLIKLCLNRTHFRGDATMSESLSEDETDRAYVYGRALRIFEEIQYAALGDVNASVVDKFYGTFSAAPAMVFARLVANAQNHLRKMRGEDGKEGASKALDRRLTDVLRMLPPSPPAGTLSLADQGRFALGYYHQKAKTFEEIAERKRAKAEKAAQ